MTTIMSMLTLVWDKYVSFEGTGAHVILFLASLLVLVFLLQGQKNRTDWYLAAYSLIALVIFACPVSAYVITRFGIGQDVYWRMLWLFPITLLIAYVCSIGIGSIGNRKVAKALCLAGCCGLIMLSGKSMFCEEIYQKAENTAHISQGVVDVCEALQEDAAGHGGTEIKGVFDPSLACYIRQYDGTIKMSFGRNVMRGEIHSDVYDALLSEETSAEELMDVCRQDDCNYLVLAAGNRFHDGLLAAGCREIPLQSGYTIYAFE